MNVNDLIALEKEQKRLKREKKKQKNRQNVLSLHEMFPHYDLSTLAALYLQAEKDVNKALNLILQQEQLQGSAQQNTTTMIKLPSLNEIRNDQRVLLLRQLFPWKTFSEQHIYQVLVGQAEGDTNIAMMILMDEYEEKKRKRKESVENQEEQEDQQLEKPPVEDIDTSLDQDHLTQNQENDLVDLISNLQEYIAAEEEFEDEFEEEFGNESEEFEVASEADSVDMAFEHSIEEVQHELNLQKLQQLVEEQQKQEEEMHRLFQEELDAQLFLEQLAKTEQQKHQQFLDDVVYHNFTRKKESDEAKHASRIAKDYENVEYSMVEDNAEFKELLMSYDKDNVGGYLNQIKKIAIAASSCGDVYVQSVYNEEVAGKFFNRLHQMKEIYPEAKITFAFHGTSSNNVSSILQSGLLAPNTPGFKHSTDTGWYGRGIYLSPNASLSMSYCRGGGKLLVCAVIPGRVFQCKGLMMGQGCVKGFDSHISPSCNEIILFSAEQVLPIFVIHFSPVYYYDKLAHFAFNQPPTTSTASIKENYMAKWQASAREKAQRRSQNYNMAVAKKLRRRNDYISRKISSNKRLKRNPFHREKVKLENDDDV